MSESTPSPVDIPVHSFEQLTADAVKLWYRRLGPNTNMREVPFEDHIDAIAISILDLLDREVPDSAGSRMNDALALTTDLSGVSQRLSLAGEKALPVIDLILELSERDDEQLRGKPMAGLLELADKTAYSIRENPKLAMDERLDANSKLSNIKLEGLRRFGGISGRNYSDQYIEVVRAEAQWCAANALRRGGPENRAVTAGGLFETYIGVLSRYQMWVSELDEAVYVRHATIREDQPTRNSDSKPEGKYAHDVRAYTNTGESLMVQCKWGPGSPEQACLYNRPTILVIAETTDDGQLGDNRAIGAAFGAIEHSGEPGPAATCDTYMARYPQLEARLSGLEHKVEIAVGKTALKTV